MGISGCFRESRDILGAHLGFLQIGNAGCDDKCGD
jgi:hypothetical protein